jgi:hypothetical protein
MISPRISFPQTRGSSRRWNILLLTVLSVASFTLLPVTTASAAPALSTVALADPAPVGSKNVVSQLASYVKDSVVKTYDSCGALWQNHGKCNAIRKQQSLYREKIAEQWELQGLYAHESRKQVQKRLAQVQGGYSYGEYVFLQKGKEDRGKVLNMAFLMWGAPRFLPYALMFNPDMLPSTFVNEKKTQSLETPAQRISRERSAAILQTMAKLEQAAKAGGAGGYLSKLNIFGKKKQSEQQEKLVNVYDETRHVLGQGTFSPRPILEKLERAVFRTNEDFSRAEQRLASIPACIVQGLGYAISGQANAGILASLQPHFLHRGKVVTHLKKVTEADDFLVQADVDLDSIAPRLLRDACSDRMLGGPDWTPSELRQGLRDWLQLAVTEPASRLAHTDGDLYYNGNVARLVLMGFYGCQGARGVGRVEPTLSQLLLCSSRVGSSESASTTDTANNQTKKVSKGRWSR